METLSHARRAPPEIAEAMAASFALHLDHDGVALHRRAPDEGVPETAMPALATASLEAPDFDAALARMHATVAAESGGDAPVLVVLPDSQILYTEAPASGLDREADEGRVRNALIGATPYDLPELVYDWRQSGGVLWIAVIAQETLDEARDFVEAHGFVPTDFLGESAGGGFPGRPRFSGRTGDAPAEATPAPVSGSTAEAAPDTAPEDSAPPVSVAHPPAAGARAADEQPQPTFSSIRRAEPSSPADLGPAAPGKAGGRPAAPRATPPSQEADAAETQAAPPRAARGPALATPRPGSSPAPAPRVTPVETGDRADAPAASLSPSAAAGKASAGSPLARIAGAALGAVRRKPRPEPDPGPSLARASAPPPLAPPGPDGPPPSASAGPVLRGAKAPPSSPTALDPEIAAPRGSAPGAGSDRAPRGIRRIERKAQGTLPAPGGAAPSQTESLDEADSLTVFGARRMRTEAGPRSGGRVLGLTLTLVLLGLMGLVALWSLWFDTDRAPETVAEAPEGAVPPPVIPLEPAGPQEGSRTDAAPPPVPEAFGSDDGAGRTSGPAESAADTAPARSAAAGEDTEDEAGPAAGPALGPEEAADPGPSAMPGEPEIAALGPDAAPPAAPETSRPPRIAPQGAEPRTFVDRADGAVGGLVVVPNPLDPDAAEAAYAVTGIWQRAPDRETAPKATSRPGVTAASVDPSGPALAPPEAPDAVPRVAMPELPAAPLPPGTVLDAAGFVVPTREGALAPGGYTVYEGRPDILPPRRPVSATDAEEEAVAPAEESTAELAGPPDPLGDARPLPRPEDAPVLEDPSDAPDPDAPAVEADPALDADIRPRSRPGLQAEADDGGEGAASPAGTTVGETGTETGTEATAAAPEEPPAQDAGETGDAVTAPSAATGTVPPTRPQPRPEALATEAERLLRQQERAEQVAREEAQAAARALADAESASRLAPPVAPEPRSRPANIAQIAANTRAPNAASEARQATARAAATPQRTEAPARTASAAAVAPAPQQARGPAVARNQRVSPDARSSTLVARQATERNALRMNAVTLIGVYGSAGQRRALVRLPSGRYVKVQVGDRLDGGQVAAIDRDALRYVKSGRNLVIQMPSS